MSYIILLKSNQNLRIILNYRIYVNILEKILTEDYSKRCCEYSVDDVGD
jgi:hypothetical protein